VSEVGFMMEDEKLQLIIGLFRELKTGQEELKKETQHVTISFVRLQHSVLAATI
jgi:hypothetical protein